METCSGTMYGVHRSLCIYSWVYRGTQQKPGLVLGLDRGGACHGLGLQVCGEKGAAVIAYLREREMVTSVYIETWRTLRLGDGRIVKALTYVVDRDNAQYTGKLSVSDQTRLVGEGYGRSGANADYVIATCDKLDEINIQDIRLKTIRQELNRL